jgi:hypothetical protein
MKKLFINKDHISNFEDENFARLLISYYKLYQKSYTWWDHDHLKRSLYRPEKYDRVWFKKIMHYGGHRVKWGLLNQLYFEGFYVLKKLKCSFFEFCDFMIYGIPTKYYKMIPSPTPAYTGWYWHWGWSKRNDFKDNHFRKKQKYQKRKGHRKKVNTEEKVIKKDWRKKKKIAKDKAKPTYRRRTSCPKYYKRLGNKRHRSWERDQIKKQNWEELTNYKKWDECLNPWDWS